MKKITIFDIFSEIIRDIYIETGSFLHKIFTIENFFQKYDFVP